MNTHCSMCYDVFGHTLGVRNMKIKGLVDSLIPLIILAAAGYGLYHYLISPPETAKTTARYQENDQETSFDQIEDGKGGLDDCYRYVNADHIQGCIEAKTKN
ncbi:MAG: hypothetical protein WBM41_00105 [Arenicellales bacterium]